MKWSWWRLWRLLFSFQLPETHTGTLCHYCYVGRRSVGKSLLCPTTCRSRTLYLHRGEQGLACCGSALPRNGNASAYRRQPAWPVTALQLSRFQAQYVSLFYISLSLSLSPTSPSSVLMVGRALDSTGWTKKWHHFYRAMHFSAKRGIAIRYCLSVCLSVCDDQVPWSHRLEFFENNFTAE